MRVLVVGLGSMGRRRLRNLQYIGGSQLAAYEPSAARCAEARREFSIPVFDALDLAIGWGPEALVISTPPIATPSMP